MTNEDLAAIKALCEKATPFTNNLVHRYDHGGARVMRFLPVRELIADFYSESERECWIACRAEVPNLIAALEASRAENARLRAILIAIERVKHDGEGTMRCFEVVDRMLSIVSVALAAKEGA